MKNFVLFVGVTFVTTVAGPAFAQGTPAKDAKPAEKTAAKDVKPAAEKAATFAAEAKLCGSVEAREAKDPKNQFATGERAYFWMKLSPNETKTESPRMKIRWSLNEKPFWTMSEVPVRWGRSWYYKTVNEPGNWTAELLDENDTVVTSLAFTATGESYKRPEAAAEEAAPKKAATP